MSRRRIARGEGVAEFLRFDADGGEHGRLSRIWRLVAARVVDGCRVRDFGWWLDRFGGCPGPRYYQCPTFCENGNVPSGVASEAETVPAKEVLSRPYRPMAPRVS